ncbi:MAG: fibronectin type III domain-containing protein [Chitinivibrionales bacterium]
MHIYKHLLTALVSVLVFSCADYDMMPEEEAPDNPVMELVEVTDTTATLSWTQAQVYDFSGYELYYGDYIDIVNTSHTLYDSLIFRQDTVVTVRGLKPSTGYAFRVITTTDHGEVGISNIVAFYTDSFDESAPEPVTITLVNIRADTVNLTWTRCDEPDFDTYVMYYDTVGSVGSVNLENAPGIREEITDRNDTTKVITDFPDSTQYWFAIFVVNSGGYYSASNVVSNR